MMAFRAMVSKWVKPAESQFEDVLARAEESQFEDVLPRAEESQFEDVLARAEESQFEDVLVQAEELPFGVVHPDSESEEVTKTRSAPQRLSSADLP